MSIKTNGCPLVCYVKRVTPNIDKVRKQPYTVAVNIQVVEGAKFHGLTEVSKKTFEQALINTIRDNSVFRTIVEAKEADYLLTVEITSMKQRGVLTINQHFNARWFLKHKSSDKIIINKNVKSLGIGKMGDALGGEARNNIAIERAMRANIKGGMFVISRYLLNQNGQDIEVEIPLR